MFRFKPNTDRWHKEGKQWVRNDGLRMVEKNGDRYVPHYRLDHNAAWTDYGQRFLYLTVHAAQSHCDRDK